MNNGTISYGSASGLVYEWLNSNIMGTFPQNGTLLFFANNTKVFVKIITSEGTINQPLKYK